MLEVLQPANVASSNGLRGIVSFALRISDKSTITQEIIMDAMCPYIKFRTEVPNTTNDTCSNRKDPLSKNLTCVHFR